MSIKKKAKGKSKAAVKAAVKTKAETKKGKDIVEVRGNIDNLVKNAAELIAAEVIKVALTGQLATARYLFEAIGLYPATEQTEPDPPVKGSLAHTLLTRMGLPTEPVVCDDDEAPVGLTSQVKAVPAASCAPKIADESVETAGEAGQEVVPPDVEE
jgi:hypothetical protein